MKCIQNMFSTMHTRMESIKSATGRTYGYGGVKLFAREAFFDKAWVHLEFPGVDVTSEVAKRGFTYP